MNKFSIHLHIPPGANPFFRLNVLMYSNTLLVFLPSITVRMVAATLVIFTQTSWNIGDQRFYGYALVKFLNSMLMAEKPSGNTLAQ